MKKCQCQNLGWRNFKLDKLYDSVTENPYRNHEPGECKCTNNIRKFNRDGKEIYLCSICYLPSDTLVNGEAKMSNHKVKMIITEECHNLIRSRATLPFVDTSTIIPDGTRLIEVDIEVYEHIKEYQLWGESVSDTLIRMMYKTQ